jgi:hypothetical protein
MTSNGLIIIQQDLYMFSHPKLVHHVTYPQQQNAWLPSRIFFRAALQRRSSAKASSPVTRQKHSSRVYVERPTGFLPRCTEFRDVLWRHWPRHWNLLGSWECDELRPAFTYLFIRNLSVSSKEDEGFYLQRVCMFPSDIVQRRKWGSCSAS